MVPVCALLVCHDINLTVGAKQVLSHKNNKNTPHAIKAEPFKGLIAENVFDGFGHCISLIYIDNCLIIAHLSAFQKK